MEGVGVLNAMFSRYKLDPAPFIDGEDTDNALLYDSSKITLVEHYALSTELRLIHGYRLAIKGTSDTIRILTCHLKAGTTPADEEQRGREAMILRQHLDSLPRTSKHIVAGDLNVYDSSEPAYQALTIVGIVPAGEVFDPINRPGDWHSHQEFADIHTQSPRVRQFGGGADGGLDDRFDQILLSGALLPNYTSKSYTTFGNDGQHFNDSINAMPNTAVDVATATALHDASDHLPVYLELVFKKGASGVEEERVWRNEMDFSMHNEQSAQ